MVRPPPRRSDRDGDVEERVGGRAGGGVRLAQREHREDVDVVDHLNPEHQRAEHDEPQGERLARTAKGGPGPHSKPQALVVPGGRSYSGLS